MAPWRLRPCCWRGMSIVSIARHLHGGDRVASVVEIPPDNSGFAVGAVVRGDLRSGCVRRKGIETIYYRCARAWPRHVRPGGATGGSGLAASRECHTEFICTS